jgi:tRNA(adenine34) deaminase
MNHEYFMKFALQAAEKALISGEFPVGCVLVYQNRVVAAGSRSGTVGTSTNEIDHAEMAALKQLSEKHGAIDYKGVAAFSTLEPCLMCFGALMIRGIGKLVYAYEDAMGGGTACDVAALPPLYRKNRMRVFSNVLRNESLQLFKAFFLDPKNSYCKGSLLAHYTLAQ